MLNDELDLTSSGSEFQAAGPENEKRRSTNFIQVLGFTTLRPVAERKRLVLDPLETGTTSSLMCVGARYLIAGWLHLVQWAEVFLYFRLK